MKTEVTATGLGYTLPPILPTADSASTIDCNSNMFQQQSVCNVYPHERLHITTRPHGLSENISGVCSRVSTGFLSTAHYLGIEPPAKFDASSLFMEELADKVRNAQQIHQEYRLRIEDLHSYAELDGLTVSEASERDFWSFIMSITFAGEAELVLLDNGNLRAIWDDENGNHFGLQFLGDREIQYVIFRHRKRHRIISRVAGRDTFDGVKLQVQSFELETLLHK